MDKQKQIEEMAKDRVAELRLFYNFCKYNGCEEKTAKDCERCYFNEVYRRLAELEGKIRNGTLKELPENAVVLTKKEYEKVKYVLKYEPEEAIIRLKDLKKNEVLYSPHMFCSLGGCSGVSKDCNFTCKESWIVKERKETAEKFTEKARAKARWMRDHEGDYAAVDIDDIDEICKEIIGETK